MVTTLPVQTIFHGTRLDRTGVRPSTRDVPGTTPVVFLNYDETLSQGELSNRFRPIGRTLAPNRAVFDVGASHANGANDSPLEIGLALHNGGATPLVLALSDIRVDRGQALGPAARRVTIAPGKTLELPIGRVAAHAGPNSRDGSRPVRYTLHAHVVAGDASRLGVTDIARHPAARVTTPQTLPDAVDPKHHEGVFYPQQQADAPVLLDDRQLAVLAIAGSQAQHDAHYEVAHRFLVALPQNRTPEAVVFRGGGGPTNPLVNGKPLPRPVYEVQAKDAAGRPLTQNGYAVLAKSQEVTLPTAEAIRLGYLRPTGTRDAAGNPVYAVAVTFEPGDNGDLSLYARY